MKFSIITPTEERAAFLQGAYKLLQNQIFQDWEWLIYDTSSRPSNFFDDRIKYFHDDRILSIGEKRNRLIDKASNEIIVHFDDDDYYHPHYLKKISAKLKKGDFFKFSSWFSYKLGMDDFFYWNTAKESESHFVLDPLTGMKIREIDLGPNLADQKQRINEKGKKGYGFSFSYLREVWKKSPFSDKDLGEDLDFIEAANRNGATIFSQPDEKGLLVHVLHEENVSKSYPQYRIPGFLLKSRFRDFYNYLKIVNYEN